MAERRSATVDGPRLVAGWCAILETQGGWMGGWVGGTTTTRLHEARTNVPTLTANALAPYGANACPPSSIKFEHDDRTQTDVGARKGT